MRSSRTVCAPSLALGLDMMMWAGSMCGGKWGTRREKGECACVCGSVFSLRTVPHSLFRCGWYSCSCCLGGIVVNYVVFFLIFLFFRLFLFSFFLFFGGKSIKISFFVLFSCCCVAYVGRLPECFNCWRCCCCCCCFCYFPLQKTNSLHTHTHASFASVCVCARMRVRVCVRAFHLFSFVLLFTLAHLLELTME